jgi:N-acetyl-anhydromuramyl-L-alanine amidase AmpD
VVIAPNDLSTTLHRYPTHSIKAIIRYELMNITKYHGNYNKTKRTKTIEYIVIHYTGTNASALNNCKYFSGGNRNASADYFIDGNGIYEYNDPADGYYTWAVGDGKGKYGIYNYNSINVEVVSSGQDFTQQEIQQLQELVIHLMKSYNIDKEHVVRHYDASRKSCPAPYVDNTKWQTLKETITTATEDEMTNDDVAKIVEQVWSYNINNHTAADRLYLCNVMDYDTSDPTGRNKELTNHDHIKWIAAELANTKEEVQKLQEQVAQLQEQQTAQQEDTNTN